MLRILLRIMIVLALGVCSALSGLSRKDVNGATTEAAKRSMHVTVSFGGLMVFLKGAKSGFDVGVLTPDVAHNHKLKILVDGVPRDKRPTGNKWTLQITSSTDDIVEANLGHPGRHPDHEAGLYDFNWIIDLRDLHGDLELKDKVFNPMIHLSNGVLYTRYKADFMERLKGGVLENDKFGFLAETIALDLEVQESQALVLASDDGGEPVIKLDYVANGPPHEIAIKNIRDPNPDPAKSDFDCYYNLFKKKIDKKDRFDFRLKKDPKERPLNPVPKPIMLKEPKKEDERTCCGLECNPVRLR